MRRLAAFAWRREKLVSAGIAVLLVGGCGLAYQTLVTREDSIGVGCYTAAADRVEFPDDLPSNLYPTPDRNRTRLTETRCVDVHRVEVIGYVDVEGDEAGCRTLGERFVGGPLDGTRVATVLLTSSVANVYPCGLAEIGDTARHVVDRRGSLRDGLRGDRALAITCMSRIDDGWIFVDCTAPHAGELVGVVTDGGRPEVSCAAAAEAYVGDGFQTRQDLRLIWFEGESGLSCFAVVQSEGNPLHATIKGLGSAALPR